MLENENDWIANGFVLVENTHTSLLISLRDGYFRNYNRKDEKGFMLHPFIGIRNKTHFEFGNEIIALALF